MLATNTKSTGIIRAHVGKSNPQISRKVPEPRFPIDAARVTERLNQMGVAPTRVAVEAKLQRTFITDILEGRKKSVNGKSRLDALAKALGVTPSYLTGAKAIRVPVEPAPDGRLRLQGIVSEGVKRTRPEAAAMPSVEVQADPRYPGAQGVYAVADESMGPHAAKGSWLLGVEPVAFLRAVGNYRAGQMVVVSLTDTDGEELVVRRLVMFPDRTELHPVSGTGAMLTMGRHPRGRRMAIKAVVLKAIQELA
jgi:transcriptional regulator with XRE-family HTH domain